MKSEFITSLSCDELVKESMKNGIVISNFNCISLSVDTLMKKEIRLNLLEHIIPLY